MVEVRCEAQSCPIGTVGLRRVNGLSYRLCNHHLRLPLLFLRLVPPLDWEGIQRLYHEIWRNGKEA